MSEAYTVSNGWVNSKFLLLLNFFQFHNFILSLLLSGSWVPLKIAPTSNPYFAAFSSNSFAITFPGPKHYPRWERRKKRLSCQTAHHILKLASVNSRPSDFWPFSLPLFLSPLSLCLVRTQHSIEVSVVNGSYSVQLLIWFSSLGNCREILR